MARIPHRLTALSLAVASAPLLALAVPAPAAAQFAFDGIAAADGTQVTAANPSIPLGVVVTGAGPSAQSRLTSLPTSDAFASVPYPGETVAGAPDLAGGATGLPIPAYPFIVSSGLGDDPKQRAAPGIDLSVSSDRFSARSDATVGSPASGSTSSTRVLLDPDDGVEAIAETTSRGAELLGALRVFGVRSTASVARDSSGVMSRKTSLSIARLSVPGLAVKVPAQVPVIGGQTVQAPDIGLVDGQFYLAVPFAGAPQRIPVPAQTVLDAMKVAGVVARYQEPVNTKDGVIAGALRLTTDLPAPPPNGTYDGPTRVTYTLGRVSAAVSLTPIDSSPFEGAASPVLPPGGQSAPAGEIPTFPLDSSGGSLNPDLGGAPDVASSGTLGGPESDAAPGTARPGGGAVPVSLFRRMPPSADIGDIYLLLAALGALGFASIWTLRVQGIRLS